jgi:hypothetical protein
MAKRLTQFISETYNFGVKDEKDLDGFDATIGNDKLVSLFRTLKKEYPSVEYPLALNRGTGGVKVRISEFDLDAWKQSNFDRPPAKKHLDSGKGSINSTGGTLNGAEWEEIICVCYNMRSKGVSLEQAKKLAGVEGSWKAKFDSALDDGFKLVDSAWTSPKGVMEHFGSGSTKLTKGWDQYFIDTTGKSAPNTTRTPKTDMYIGNQRISLKKAGGSQFMSGGQAETLATLAYVYDALPQSMKTREYEKAWRTLEKDIQQKFTKINIGKNRSIRDVRKDIKAGMEDEITKAVADAISSHEVMQTTVRNLFESMEARKALVYESMTGKNKFSDPQAIASHIMVFDPDTGKASYYAIDDKLVESYARAINFQVNFKKGGSSSTPYTNFRIGLNESIEELDELLEEDIYFDNEMLEEALLGKVGAALKRFVKGAASKLWRKVKRVASKSFKSLQKITGRKLTAKEPKVKWKL